MQIPFQYVHVSQFSQYQISVRLGLYLSIFAEKVVFFKAKTHILGSLGLPELPTTPSPLYLEQSPKIAIFGSFPSLLDQSLYFDG